MRNSASLRVRLIVIILAPLLALSAVLGALQVMTVRDRANDLFDRALLSAALAVSRDVAASDGDAVSLATRDLLSDTSGGRVFYHVYAPDGVFVTGYASPPAPVRARPGVDDTISYFYGRYKGADMRVLRVKDVTQIDGISGVFTITVWQDVEVRGAFVRKVVMQSFLAIAALIGTVALVVWFGVSLGLRPLLALEEAISVRSSDDLSPIRRRVPVEARGLVERLNTLFEQVTRAMATQREFISNAAHQLRNPIAGVRALAESVETAPDATSAKSRAQELVQAATHASDLAEKLLALERAQNAPLDNVAVVDLGDLARAAVAAHERVAEAEGVTLEVDAPVSVPVAVDEIMVSEALVNIVDNALKHGGRKLSRIAVVARAAGAEASVTITDDGIGVADEARERIRDRFVQEKPGGGSGLGLSIVDAVAAQHGGRLEFGSSGQGLSVTLRLPLANPIAGRS